MVSKDTLWKAIIEDLIEEFLRYFYPDLVERIDFAKGFDFLDKELDQLSPPSESGRRHADKLIKAWLVSGEEQWFLVHVEVQGYSDPGFARRMFQYGYRIYDRYQQRLAALAIYTDADPNNHVSEYRESFVDTAFYYKFRAFSLVGKGREKLLQEDNIFGLALEVARRELVDKAKSDWDLLAVKTKLVRYLFQQNIGKEKVRKLLNFIKFYTNFGEESFYKRFEEKVQVITKSRKAMGIEEAILHEVKTKAEAKGREEGREEGLVKGMDKKEHIVVARGLERDLSPEDIAFLADMPLEKVLAVMAEISEEEEE